MNEKTLSLHIPTQSAGNADEWYLSIPWAGIHRLTRIEFAPATAVAVDGTNYETVTITKNDGAAGSDSSAIATIDTNTAGGNTPLVLKTTIAPTLTQRGEFSRGHQIKVAKTVAGTGQILDGTFVFVFEKAQLS